MRYACLILVLLSGVSDAPARTAAFEDSSARATIQRVVERTFVMRYDEALAVADSLELLLPEHPVVPLMKAGVLYCRMLDHEDLLDLEAFDEYYDTAWDGAKDLSRRGESAEAELYQGVLLGFRALLHQRMAEWLPAVRLGLKSVAYLESCLKKDPGYADALLGVGTYKYWRSRATDFLKFLPFIADERETGVAMVRQAMQDGLFGREISRSTLAWILIDYGHPSEAVTLSLQGLQTYPGSRFYLWTLADGYMQTRQWRKANRTYQELFASVHSLPRNNHYNEMGLCKQIARCHRSMGQPDSALVWVERGLALPLDKEVRKRRGKDVERLEAMRRELQTEVEK